MGLNNHYNFAEAELGTDFAQDKLREFKKLIQSSLSFVVISMPGVGVSYFLRYLTMQDFAFFVHIDLYSLPTLSQHELYKLLLAQLGGKSKTKTDPDSIGTDEQLLEKIKKTLIILSQKEEKIVLIFSRFDQLKNQLDWNFLSNIQSLTTVAPGKIVEIFTSTRPLYELAPEATSGGNLNFYSEQVYFKPFSKNDLRKLCEVDPIKPISKECLDHLLDLSGGHNQLLHILLSSQKQQNLLLDNFVKLQMKELIDYLDYFQKKALQKIALGKNIPEIDDYLLGVGMVRQLTSEVKKMQLHLGGVYFELFTPLLTEYIKTNLPVKLPVKEAKLFKLLKKHLGETVSKDDIFTEVWGENSQEATDWALDALIYRLRKHPFMKVNGYIIESHKKVGYTLIQT